MIQAIVNRVSEITLISHINYPDPFNQVSIKAEFTSPDGSIITIPAFWSGDQTWKLRFAPAAVGEYQYLTSCSDTNNSDLHGQSGQLLAAPYTGSNPLYKHGAVSVMPDQRHLQHADGTPFFWLADTWWMAFCSRISFPDEFRELTRDRLSKNFSVIQIIAGLYPDMPWYDERGANEAGFPWCEDFSTLNPAYFDMVDLRVAHLVENGLMPCIVAAWGYFMDFAGMEVLKKHWAYLIARYSAYPVAWCTAGEALMKYYLAESNLDPVIWKQQRQGEWSELVRWMRSLDGHQRLITIHPTQYGREQLSDPNLIDFEMLQTGHGSFHSLGPTINMLEHALQSQPQMPVLVSEVNYEGIGESSREEVQRFHFWSCLLSGAMGHTYGANGLWQLNGREKPYGPSPHGTSWGNLPWPDAAALPGSRQLGLGKALLQKYPWWKLEKHPEWISHPSTESDRQQCYLAGIPAQLRILFYPTNCSWLAWQGKLKIMQLEEQVRYHCFYFDPKSGCHYDLGFVQAQEYCVPKPPIFQDWVLIMEAAVDESLA